MSAFLIPKDTLEIALKENEDNLSLFIVNTKFKETNFHSNMYKQGIFGNDFKEKIESTDNSTAAEEVLKLECK